MFDLNNAIVNWRREMAAAGIKNPTLLDELESHLREDVERQVRSGENIEKAFAVAASRVGEAGALEAEFAKNGKARRLPEKLMLAVAGLFLALILFLSAAAIILCYSSLTDRIINGSAVLCILAVACCWPRAVPLLPAIMNARKRTALAVVCILGGIGLSTLYCQILLPYFHVPYDRQVPAAGFWMVFFIALGLGLGAGVEKAGQRAKSEMLAT